MHQPPRLLSLALIAFFVFTACEPEKVPDLFKPRNDHEAYEYALKQANLLTSALGVEWQKAAQNSLTEPVQVRAPYEEAFYLDPNEAGAMGYRFAAKEGQKIQVTVTSASEDSIKLFMDLYRVEESHAPIHVATADKTSLTLGFEPRKSNEYILRFQPELLRGGSFKVTIENVPTLRFPVAGKTARAIGSFWGAPRDGGRRKHEGVDIFARRGTPVVAPTDGYVRFVGERGIGGKVVWLRDNKRGQSLYFAHLNELIAKQGTYVKVGDTLGTVGNTGNARTTPPHLHFGVYKNGAVDPLAFLKVPRTKYPKVGSDFGLLGQYARLNRNTRIKADPTQKGYSASLSRNELARVVSVNQSNYRIELPNGEQGYVSKRHLSSLERPMEMLSVNIEGDFLKQPDENSFWQSLEAGEQVALLGRHDNFWFVKNSAGETGWITDEQTNAPKLRVADPD